MRSLPQQIDPTRCEFCVMIGGLHATGCPRHPVRASKRFDPDNIADQARFLAPARQVNTDRVMLHCPQCGMPTAAHADQCEHCGHSPTITKGNPVTDVDMVNHPPHYRHPSGIQCIEISRQCHGDLSAVVQYIWRYNAKGTPEQDLAKARWYVRDVIANGLNPHPPLIAREMLLNVVVAEPDELKRALLFNVATGKPDVVIKLINDAIGDDQSTTTETEQ